MLETLQKLLRGKTEYSEETLDFRNISPPNQEILADRQRRIDELKLGIRGVYLLAKPIAKKDTKKET